jgi:uncharacterized membrane protein
MLTRAIEFADLLIAALVAGGMFGVWLIVHPAGLAANVYITLHQNAIRRMNRSMPILGAVTILLTVAAAVMERGDRTRAGLLIAATFPFVVAGVVTRFISQPINAIVTGWRSDSPPENWMELCDRWWRWHVVRLLAGLGGLSLVILATLLGRR